MQQQDKVIASNPQLINRNIKRIKQLWLGCDVESLSYEWSAYFYDGTVRSMYFSGFDLDEQRVWVKYITDKRGAQEANFAYGLYKKLLDTPLNLPKLIYAEYVSAEESIVVTEQLLCADNEKPQPMSLPVTSDAIKQWFDLYELYREHWPKIQLGRSDFEPSALYYRSRLMNWYCSAKLREQECLFTGDESYLAKYWDDMIQMLNEVDDMLKIFQGLPMWFSHGHFVHDEVYMVDGKPYIIGMTKARYTPPYYEVSLQIWAFIVEWLKHPDDYVNWKEVLSEYLSQAQRIYGRSTWDAKVALNAALGERILGTMLMDIPMWDDSIAKQRSQVAKLFGLWSYIKAT